MARRVILSNGPIIVSDADASRIEQSILGVGPAGIAVTILSDASPRATFLNVDHVITVDQESVDDPSTATE